MKSEEYKLTMILLQVLRKEDVISDTVAGKVAERIGDMGDASTSPKS